MRSLRLLQDLSIASCRFPSIYWLNNVRKTGLRKVSFGGEASIFGGTHNGSQVVIRVPNVSDELASAVSPGGGIRAVSPDKCVGRTQAECLPPLQDICRELITHWQLRHNHIIKLAGVFREDETGIPSMILPYMAHGSASNYLKDCRDAHAFLEVVSGHLRPNGIRFHRLLLSSRHLGRREG